MDGHAIGGREGKGDNNGCFGLCNGGMYKGLDLLGRELCFAPSLTGTDGTRHAETTTMIAGNVMGTWSTVSFAFSERLFDFKDSESDCSEDEDEFVAWYSSSSGEEDEEEECYHSSDEHEESEEESTSPWRGSEHVDNAQSLDHHHHSESTVTAGGVYPSPCGVDSGAQPHNFLYVDDHIPIMHSSTTLEVNMTKGKAGVEAAAFAQKHRGRYDSVYHSLYHREWDEYEWSDPALPLLEGLSHPNHVLFRSDSPFNIPHVVLTLSEKPRGGEETGNYPPCPQDQMFGNRLTVTACMMPVINVALPPAGFDEVPSYGYEDYESEEEVMDEEDTESESSEEEEEIQTPKDDDEVLLVDHNPFIDLSLAGPPLPSTPATVTSKAPPSPSPLASSQLEMCGYDGWQFEPDEDNELHPFDEWYLARLPCS